MNKKLWVIGIIIIVLVIGISGCVSPNKSKYQTFYSSELNQNYFSIVENSSLNISEDDIKGIIQDGKMFAFSIDYPVNWAAQFYMGGFGVFSVIFFPITTNFSKISTASHITIDIIPSSQTIYLNQLENELKIDDRFKDYDKKDYKLDECTRARIFIGHVNFSGDYSDYENYNQGFAMISYNNDNDDCFELYLLSSYFYNNDSLNIDIFNHIAKSFKKLSDN